MQHLLKGLLPAGLGGRHRAQPELFSRLLLLLHDLLLVDDPLIDLRHAVHLLLQAFHHLVAKVGRVAFMSRRHRTGNNHQLVSRFG